MKRITGDRGEAVTETVLLVPVLILLIMLVIQFGLWYHAQHVVQAAAQEGVRAARAENGTADDGTRRATAFLDQVGGNTIQAPEVASVRSDEMATVTVDAHAAAVIPGLSLDVHATASSPIEEFSAP